MSIPVLLIGFNRPDLIKNQLALLASLNINKIYVAIDGGRNTKEQSLCDQSVKAVQNFKFNGEKHLKYRNYNLGCGLGVVSALDWFYSLEEFGIVLEDDCVPTSDTFRYFEENIQKIITDPHLGMLSAHNPCKETRTEIYSSYIFINGWMTTREKYEKIRMGMYKLQSPIRKKIPGPKWRFPDSIYWWSTSTRVKLGGHDTWDSPFLERFSTLGYRCLVPRKNLIQNVGFGISASHTKDENGSIFLSTKLESAAINQSNFDSIIRNDHFQIRRRHSVTPFYRILIDLFSHQQKNFEEILQQDRMKYEKENKADC